MANLQVGVAGNGTVTVGAGASVHSPASNILTLGTNNAERVRINSSGNMGLGDLSNVSNNPQVLLHIASSSPTLRIQDTTNDFYGHISADDGGSLSFDSDAGNGAGSSKLVFKTDGSEKLRITNGGKLLLGTTSDTSPIGWGNNLQVAGTSAVAGVSIRRDSADTGGALLVFGKSRGSLNGNTVVQDGDQIGGMYFAGGDGTDVNSIAAQLSVEVDGAPGSNDMPGRILLKTTSDGAASPTERLRINKDGNILLGRQRTYGDQAYYDDITINNSNNASGADGGTGINLISGNNSWGALLFGDSDDSDVGYVKYSHAGNYMRFGVNAGIMMRIDSDGVKFNSETAAANGLDDYEEGNITWYLRKSDNTSGGSDNGSVVKYTKVGRMVVITGRIRTDSVSSSSSHVYHLDGTLPFTPATAGTAVVGHWRSQDIIDGTLTASIAWQESSTTIYLYSPDSVSDYAAASNNVGTNNQTNLVCTFTLCYQST